MIIDTHSHLNFKAFDNDRNEVIKRTQKEGVICIDVGTKYETSKLAVELAEKNENIFAAIGMHPIHINPVRNSPPIGPSGAQSSVRSQWASNVSIEKQTSNGASVGVISNGVKTDPLEGAFEPLGEEFNKERYKKMASSQKVVAIGEVGLDYYYRPKTKTKQEKFKEKQKEIFTEQLKMAEELNLPVIVHCRMAHEDVLDILKSQFPISNYQTNSKIKIQKIRGVIHCFTGSWEQAQKYMDLGFYIGFNGIIFKLHPIKSVPQSEDGAAPVAQQFNRVNLDEVIKKTPLDKILIETDCPYLTPLPAVALAKEGPELRNEPIFVKYVAKRIAELRGISFEEVAGKTTENAQNLFKI